MTFLEDTEMLMKGVYRNGNGGWQLPGEGVYHTQTECPTVRQHSDQLEYVVDVRELEQCITCRRIVDQRVQSRRHYGSR